MLGLEVRFVTLEEQVLYVYIYIYTCVCVWRESDSAYKIERVRVVTLEEQVLYVFVYIYICIYIYIQTYIYICVCKYLPNQTPLTLIPDSPRHSTLIPLAPWTGAVARAL